MAETVDELTIEWIEDGQVVTHELDKVVLTKGTWATLLYKYQDMDKASGQLGKAKFRLQRYQKRQGKYQRKDKFNISSVDQARQIIEVLTRWVAEADSGVEPAAASSSVSVVPDKHEAPARSSTKKAAAAPAPVRRARSTKASAARSTKSDEKE
jgi:hypothetical protein